MKKLVLPFFVGSSILLGAFNCSSQNNDCKICGSWQWEKNDDRHDFSVVIYLKDGFISGTHCYILDSGKKMDCATDSKEVSFKVINPKTDSIILSIRSYYSGKSGDVKLENRNGKLYWKLIRAPKGEYYFPKEAILIAEKK